MIKAAPALGNVTRAARLEGGTSFYASKPLRGPSGEVIVAAAFALTCCSVI